jgi:methionyl-tRNA formyltransferase
MHMNAWMDTWDIIDQLFFPLKFERTVKDLITALEKEWPKFLCNTLWNYGKKHVKAKPQNETEATICQKIEKSDWEIDVYKDSLEDIYAKYRAYTIWPKIWFKLNEKIVIIEELQLDESKYNENKNKPLIEWKNLNPAVTNIAIKPEWKKAMDWKSFCNGYLR